MTDSFYVYETQHEPETQTQADEYPRTCGICGTGMIEGYLHEPSGVTLCSLSCANNTIPADEQLPDEFFWTTWHDEVEGLA